MEAVLVIPVFLTFVIGLLFLIRIAFTEIALQNAADETAKQFAGVLYPLDSTLQQAASHTGVNLSNSLSGFVPDFIREAVEVLVQDQIKQPIYQKSLSVTFKPLYWHFIAYPYKDTIISYERLKIEHVSIPYINNNAGMFGIEVSYEINLALPFYQKKIMVRKRAYERAWIGA